MSQQEQIAILIEALEIIAGQRPCLDCLMSDKDVAIAALALINGKD